jgi:hypothetical protein
MSKLTSTATICQALELYNPAVKVGHDRHGYGKVIFADFGLRFEEAEPEICWTVEPTSETGRSIIAAIRPAKQGTVKKRPDLKTRLSKRATRMLKNAARLEALLDKDRWVSIV